MKTTDIELGKFRFLIFCRLWAIACLFHFHWIEFAFAPENRFALYCAFVVTALALLTLLCAETKILFPLLLASVVFDVGRAMPFVPNHWLLAGTISFTLGLLALTQRQSLADAFASSRPVVLGEVALFYFFTFFWKLNSGFLTIENSCGTRFFGDFDRWLGISRHPASLDAGIVYGTLFLEMLLPFLLAARRTRALGVTAAVLFHFCLGLHIEHMFLNFSSVMFALLWLIAPDGLIQKMLPAMEGSGIFAPRYWNRWLTGSFLLLFLYLLTLSHDVNYDFFMSRQILWFLYGFCALSLVIYATLNGGWKIAEQLPPISRLGWFLIVCVTLNGLSPWLGFKTGSSWQMYSNIQIDDKSSNHLFIPRSLDLFGKLADSVHVVSSQGFSEALQGRYTVHELRRLAEEFPDAMLTYQNESDEPVTVVVGRDPRFNKPLPLAEAKLMRFIPLDSSSLCVW